MTTPSRQQLRDWSAALTLGPLDPADPAETRYVALADAGRAPVDELMATIELAFDTTTQLLSGPSGSGKTTELYRLRGELEESRLSRHDLRHRCLRQRVLADRRHGIPHRAGPGRARCPRRSRYETRPGFTGRLRRLMDHLKISVDVPGLSASVSRDGLEVEAMGASVEFDLQRELKSSESVVAELRRKLTYHIGRLYEEVADSLTALLPADDPGLGSVLIVDGLEKLRGTSENDLAVQESVQALFVAHASKLRFRSHHMIYTVPT